MAKRRLLQDLRREVKNYGGHEQVLYQTLSSVGSCSSDDSSVPERVEFADMTSSDDSVIILDTPEAKPGVKRLHDGTVVSNTSKAEPELDENANIKITVTSINTPRTGRLVESKSITFAAGSEAQLAKQPLPQIKPHAAVIESNTPELVAETIQKSSRDLAVWWRFTDNEPKKENLNDFRIVLHNLQLDRTTYYRASPNEHRFDMVVTSGVSYRVTVEVYGRDPTSTTGRFLNTAPPENKRRKTTTQPTGLLCSATTKIVRMIFNKDELKDLKSKAAFYLRRDKPRSCSIFYRNKSQIYFDNVMYNRGGVMEAYMKDMGGDQACPLNGRLKGLFFCCKADPVTGLPPPSSPYGEKRLHLPDWWLMEEQTNLYFADFFCTSKGAPHNVILVLTWGGDANKPRSEADKYCERHLIKLDKGKNPFLYRTRHGITYVSQRVWVEIFYTEDIDLNVAYERGVCSIENCHLKKKGPSTSAQGGSTAGGLGKPVKCTDCNVYL